MRFAIALTMFVFWLLLSGHGELFLVASGAVAAVLVALFAGHLAIADREGHPINLIPCAILYWPWLAWQMVVSALQVARLIVSPGLPISPVLVRIKAGQATPVGLTTYANSITLTPGTISVEVSSLNREILVHGITRETAAGLADGEMDRRVSRMEGRAA